MIFPYVKVPTPDPLIPWKFLPLIPIRIFNNRRDTFLEILALMDSGAEKSVFNEEIAKALEIDLSEAREEKFTGIEGGVLRAKVKNIALRIVGGKEIVGIPVGFLENAGFSAILGQEGFFEQFAITFNKKKLEIRIKKV